MISRSARDALNKSARASLPAPKQKSDWLEALPIAQMFWQRVADDLRVSPQFSAIAATAETALERARRRVQ
ncbi:MAG: hypothetical protein WAV67_05625 [Dokdonella sp.]